MTIVKNLLGSGLAGVAAQSIVGRVTLGQTASGAAQGGQTLVSSINEYTSSTANYGPTLPSDSAPGDTYTVFNNTANTMKVWPASGYKINGGTTDAAVSITTLKSAQFVSLGNGNWIGMLSA